MGLSQEQIEFYWREGYLTSIPALTRAEVDGAFEAYQRILSMLPEGKKVYQYAQWEKHNDYILSLARHPRIVDYVRSLIGPDFYVWDAYFFTKDPHEDITSQYHCDMASWPMRPGRHASVFLALTRTTVDNGCLRVVAESHLGRYRHVTSQRDAKRFLFRGEIPDQDIDREKVRYLELEPGEMSFHHELTAHGSGPNRTDTMRVGLAIRYAGYEVDCNRILWPRFSILPIDGIDRYGLNPIHPEPTGFGMPGPRDKPHFPPGEGAMSDLVDKLRRKLVPHRLLGAPQPQVDRTYA